MAVKAKKPKTSDNQDLKNLFNRNLKNLIISTIFFAILVSIRLEGILFLVIFLVINTAYNLSVLHGSLSKKNIYPIVKCGQLSILLPAALIFLLLAPWTFLQAKLNISGASTEWIPSNRNFEKCLEKHY